ncbi:hypothetical protein J6590_086560 [Homalodisca vitripennis]|nr:hypothetical protein J6590_086560 [Homalodisca vitripennis]
MVYQRIVATRAARKSRERFPGARLPYSQHRKLVVPGTDRSNAESDLRIHFALPEKGSKGLVPGVIPEKTPSAVQSTHQSLRQFRDTPRFLRYAPVEKKEEVTSTWGRRKEEVGEISSEKIKDVELRSERP